jgi:hypothetical protein
MDTKTKILTMKEENTTKKPQGTKW